MRCGIVKNGFLIIAATAVVSMGFDAKQGDIWTGGSFSFYSKGVKYNNSLMDSYYGSDRINQLSFSPLMRFFAFNNFCIGPKFNWVGAFSSGSNANVIEIGGDLGFAGSARNLYPYLITSPYASIYESEGTFVLPFNAGLMIKVSDHLGLQFEFGLSFGFEEAYTMNTIAIGIGVCGFGKSSAISILNKLGQIYY